MTPDHTTMTENDIPTEFNPSAEFSIAEGPRDVGLVFIGDSLVSGYGDPKALGWVVPGRGPQPSTRTSTSRRTTSGCAVTPPRRSWPAGGPSARRAGRTAPRSGWWSASAPTTSVSGTTTARSRLNLANIIDDAAATGIATFVVGAPPTLDPDFNRRLEVLVEAQADVCARRSVPFVDCYRPLPTTTSGGPS